MEDAAESMINDQRRSDMPNGDGRGFNGQGPGTGRGGVGFGSAGGGRGRNNGGAYGNGGECVCAACGATAPHQRGVPCTQLTCPKCGKRMIRAELLRDRRKESNA